MFTVPTALLDHMKENFEQDSRLHSECDSPPVKYFTDRSKAVLLLWIIYVISVLFCYAFMHVCLLMSCGHLLGKD